MNLTLAQDERVVKTWEYGILKGLFLKHGKFTLVVTNKRIISFFDSKKETSREEYDLRNIMSVNAAYKYKRRFFFFKRGCLELSFITGHYDTASVIGLSAISAKPSLLARIPLIGGLFAGKKSKVRVYVKEAKDIVDTFSAIVMDAAREAN